MHRHVRLSNSVARPSHFHSCCLCPTAMSHGQFTTCISTLYPPPPAADTFCQHRHAPLLLVIPLLTARINKPPPPFPRTLLPAFYSSLFQLVPAVYLFPPPPSPSSPLCTTAHFLPISPRSLHSREFALPSGPPPSSNPIISEQFSHPRFRQPPRERHVWDS